MTLTFGIELEAVKLSPQYRALVDRNVFAIQFDRSIKGDNGEDLPESYEQGGGAELVTRPLAFGVNARPNGRVDIDLGPSEGVVRDLCSCAAKVNLSCGLHVHLGRPVQGNLSRPEAILQARRGTLTSFWSEEQVRTMLVIGLNLEDKLYGLCPPSRRTRSYCKPIRACYTDEELRGTSPIGQVSIYKHQNSKRYCWLNTTETVRNSPHSPKTIEIRMMGCVRRFDYVVAWIKLWCKIAGYVASFPSSVAVMNCCVLKSLEDSFTAISKAKNDRGVRVQSRVASHDASISRDSFAQDVGRSLEDEQRRAETHFMRQLCSEERRISSSIDPLADAAASDQVHAMIDPVAAAENEIDF